MVYAKQYIKLNKIFFTEKWYKGIKKSNYLNHSSATSQNPKWVKSGQLAE